LYADLIDLDKLLIIDSDAFYKYSISKKQLVKIANLPAPFLPSNPYFILPKKNEYEHLLLYLYDRKWNLMILGSIITHYILTDLPDVYCHTNFHGVVDPIKRKNSVLY